MVIISSDPHPLMNHVSVDVERRRTHEKREKHEDENQSEPQ